MKRPHLTQRGRFRSDKFEWCKVGYLALSFTDVTAQSWIYGYAALRGIIDREFQEDVHTALVNAGYAPGRLYSVVIHGLLFVQSVRYFLYR